MTRPTPGEMFSEQPLEHVRYEWTDETSFVLRPSPRGGVGVFLTHGVAAGTVLQVFPSAPGTTGGATRFLSEAELAASPRRRAMAAFYGVEGKGGYYVADHFGRMEIGWYLNHDDVPNAVGDATDTYRAVREIAAGEEVTIDYRTLLPADDATAEEGERRKAAGENREGGKAGK